MTSVNDRGPLGGIENEIENHIVGSTWPSAYRDGDDGQIYVIKYLPPKRLGSFLASGKKLYASDVAGFTWGDGIYVAPLAAPFTTMMYGRIGVVGRIQPQRIYDATGTVGRDLYQAWIRFQWQWYNLLTTTIHANGANRYLRNAFKTKFKIDCVLFRPDQYCPGYVGPNSDVWFAVTHFNSNRVASGASTAVMDAEWCVTISEEFTVDSKNLVYDAMLGPAFRGARLGRKQLQTISPSLSVAIRDCYKRRRVNPAEAVLLVGF